MSLDEPRLPIEGRADPESGGPPPPDHVDVIIVGAGLSGIGAAWHLKHRCPGRGWLILEARDAIGGTWDLFRYPGIRSDSDMFTLGYAFKPWTEAKAIADGPSILDYVRQTAAENGIDRRIRFRHRVTRADWSSRDARWTVEAVREGSGETVRLTCNFLHLCSGYYDYGQGHDPDWPGRERFAGRIVHPQFWPEDLDYRERKVVVIGSGATAVTLVPALAEQAAHVTMLQRSPTYIVSRPSRDRIADTLRRLLPAKLAYGLVRWKNVLLQLLFFQLARKRPAKVKAKLLRLVRDELGPDYDVETHFTPRYNPWQQRLCLVPDSDLFEAIREGRASVVTDEIESFTEKGLKLRSGGELEADIVATATGLKVKLLGDVAFTVDGAACDFSRSLTYKGMMFSDVPNLAYTFGYTNASWTLKADLTALYLCRLLNHMARTGCTTVVPRRGTGVEEVPFIDFTSGYVQRALASLPKQGSRRPWKLHQNYALDLAALKLGRVDDGTLVFTRGGEVPARVTEAA
ncbi:flavin-containing monooxygenase [Sphingosinicella terrae]|uniref:flavin-containing monooxygenase n=1 Tax=Sphingosinicella terrae TaxID=2172047 RepID=UPI000E0DAEEF|nr:NAD(P)/FAD-dependent oxidoreductase [Sphingosinicella terrae]